MSSSPERRVSSSSFSTRQHPSSFLPSITVSSNPSTELNNKNSNNRKSPVLPRATQQEHLTSLLQEFWDSQFEELTREDFDVRALTAVPMARVKKIMKEDELAKNVSISTEAVGLLTKACELFVLEMTLRSGAEMEVNKRKTLKLKDIMDAVRKSDMYDFLVDIIPRNLDAQSESALDSTDLA